MIYLCALLFQHKSNTPSESNLALFSSALTSDQAEWNLGQDDSVLSGKQLPPSPRKRDPSRGHTESLFVLSKESPTPTHSSDYMGFHKTCTQSPNSSEETMPLCSPRVFQMRETQWNETLSSTSVDQMPPNLSQNPSSSVPWEREATKGSEILEEGGLLHEVVSLCKMTSVFNHGLNISGDKYSSSN